MPTYVYGVIEGDADDEIYSDVFEIEQSVNDPPLRQHPETGAPVVRLICAPFIAGTWSPLKAKRLLSSENLTKRGLTRYEKTSEGYRKTGGSGPDIIPRSSGNE
jgi:hypothetical protein